ncbi:regulation of photomorphogenesis [Paramecium bursaria]
MFKDIDINEIEKLKKDKELLSLKRAPTNIKERFGQSNKDILDEEFKQKTVGLVTREEFKRKRENIDNLVVADMKQKEEEEQRKKLQLKQKRKEEIHKKATLLSFDLDEEQQNEAGYGKDTTVDTTYLPDMNREKKIEELTKKYQEQYLQEVQNQKASFIDIKFQYWEASSGVKTLRIKKSTTVLEFVELARKEIIRDFGFLREFSPDDLIIVANEMILPHKLSFYDLIAYKVKNRSENLIFNFERVKVQVKGQEYEVEIEKSTTVRIIEKYKYEKIKHIYPCSIWENVDMSKYL